MKKAHITVLILLGVVAIFGFNNLLREKKTVNKSSEPAKTEESAKLEENFSQDANFYIVDVKKSSLAWHATQNTIKNEHYGTVDISQGVIIHSEGEFVAGDFVVNMTTIQDDDNNEFLEGHLRGDDFFDVEKHPTAKLKFLEINKTDTEDLYKIKANLTIKKITKTIEFEAIVTFNNESLEAEADFEIDRTEWDVRYGSGKFFQDIGDKLIEDQIKFKIKISAQI